MAATRPSMMGTFDLVGTILSGWLSDRYDSRYLLCWYYGMRGLSLAWLPSADFTPGSRPCRAAAPVPVAVS